MSPLVISAEEYTLRHLAIVIKEFSKCFHLDCEHEYSMIHGQCALAVLHWHKLPTYSLISM